MVDSRLEALDQPGNKEELERQVFGLLVLNSFIRTPGTETVAASTWPPPRPATPCRRPVDRPVEQAHRPLPEGHGHQRGHVHL